MTRKTWFAGLVLALVAGVVSSFGTLAYANHQFSDVATGTFFHDTVGAIKTAGCAGGYPDGTFRTGDAVNRGQFTLWFQNCLPRIARSSSNSPTTFPAAGPTASVLLSDSMTIGGFAGEKQFLRITAVVDVRPTNSNFACPGTGSAVQCDTDLFIQVNGVGTVSTQTVINAATDTVNNFTYARNVTVDATVKVTTGDTITYSLRGISNTGTGGFTALNRSLTGQTVPFGPSGTDFGP